MSADSEGSLPIASPVVGSSDSAPVAVPCQGLDAATRNALSREMKTFVNSAITSESRRFERRLSSMERSIIRDCAVEWKRELPILVKKSLDEYTDVHLPNMVSKKMEELFPVFVSNSAVINRYLDEHLEKVDNMIRSRQNLIAEHINEIAKETADKMTNTSTFGHIYESLKRTSNATIKSEALKVKGDVVTMFEAEVALARQQRDEYAKELNKIKQTYSKYIETQRVYQNISVASAALSVVGLAVGLYHSCNRK